MFKVAPLWLKRTFEELTALPLQTKKITIIIFSIYIMTCLAQRIPGENVKYDFESGQMNKSWRGWSLEEQEIMRTKDKDAGHALTFAVNNEKSWNTALIDISPHILVEATTVLQFRIKTSQKGAWEINLWNASEGARYAALFNVKKRNEWTTVRIALKDAGYKRFGKSKIPNDGMLGDELECVQIAYRGKKMSIDNFEIVNLSELEIKNISSDNSRIVSNYLNHHKKQSYSKFSRNGVFPFGVVITLKGNEENAKIFKQAPLERYNNNLLRIKKCGFNTVANFCNKFDTNTTLDLMKNYHLYLINTATSGIKINSSKIADLIKSYSHHPNLLAWYGKDEPTDLEAYLKNKKYVETLAENGAPYTSAIHMNSILRILGPCMDVVIINPYSLTTKVTPERSSTILSKHSVNINIARQASKRVWLMPQAFSMRTKGAQTLRYPRPVELRFEIFHALANGCNGFIFFIYNDTVPYLDKTIRAEEFDYTMVDAWGNENDSSRELSILAKRLTPIMPSFLDARKTKKFKLSCSDPNIIIRQWKNELGTLVFCVNSNLTETSSTKLKLSLPELNIIYDLDTLKPFNKEFINLNLSSGDCGIFLISNETKFKKAMSEINFRMLIAKWEDLDIKLKELKEAGFNTAQIQKELMKIKPNKKTTIKTANLTTLNKISEKMDNLYKTNSQYCDIKQSLERIKKTFGEINAMLIAPGVIEKIDKNPDWHDFFEAMKKTSCIYFSILSDWKHGKFEGSMKKLSPLEKKTQELKRQATAKLF